MKITAYYACEDKELEVEFDSPDELFAFEARMDELQAERDEQERIEEEEEEEQERAEEMAKEERERKAVEEAKSGLRKVVEAAQASGVSARHMAEAIMSTIREMRDDAEKADKSEKSEKTEKACCSKKCSCDK